MVKDIFEFAKGVKSGSLFSNIIDNNTAVSIVEQFNKTPYADRETLIQSFETLNNSGREWLKSLKELEATSDGLINANNSAAITVKKLGEGFKLAAKNMGVMLAVTVALKAAYAIFDHFNVTAEEQQEKVDGWASKVEELKSKYDELKGKNLSADEEKELEYLKLIILKSKK